MRTAKVALFAAFFLLPAHLISAGVPVQTQLNECLLPPVQGASELLGCSLKFNSMGEIALGVKNRGTVGINTAPSLLAAGGARSRNSAPPAGPPIRIDVYMQDKLIESVYQPSLGAGASKSITVKIPSNYSTPRCAETRALKLVIDPQNQIAETSDSNNVLTRSADRPCPDMTVEYIKKNWNKYKTEFVAEIRLVNRGNSPARFSYIALASPSGVFAPLPAGDFDNLMELEPGKGKKFTVGSALAINRLYVRVLIDRFNEIAELNEGNNFVEETLNN